MTGKEKANTEKITEILHSKISYLKNSRNRISRRGSKTIRPTSLFVKRAQVILKRYLEKVIQHAIAYATEDKRQIVSALDIAKALIKLKQTTCDKNFPTNISCTEEKSKPEIKA